jgi:hypothetical protein
MQSLIKKKEENGWEKHCYISKGYDSLVDCSCHVIRLSSGSEI